MCKHSYSTHASRAPFPPPPSTNLDTNARTVSTDAASCGTTWPASWRSSSAEGAKQPATHSPIAGGLMRSAAEIE
eukprot:scaffold67260_cov68-Phaeocystis_antarctica.AAC.1